MISGSGRSTTFDYSSYVAIRREVLSGDSGATRDSGLIGAG